MLDIHLFRNSPEVILTALKNRHVKEDVLALIESIKKKDETWRKIKKEEEELRAERNKLNNEIINFKKEKKEKEAQKAIKRSGDVSTRVKEITLETEHIEKELTSLLLYIPNIPDASVPKGKDSSQNTEIRTFGKPKKHSTDVLSHYDFGMKTGLIDFERGVKLAGHRFAVLKGEIAKLERALINYMLSLQTSRGYLEILPPHLVNTASMQGTGQLPKFEEQLYKCRDDDLWLVPTAEVPLTNLFANELLAEEKLPIKLTAYTPCYRREAGEYGRDIKGLIRQHQFNKVELVKFAHPQNSFNELESLTRDAQAVLESLELPYRVVALCTGDLGFGSAKTYDLEVWLPSQDTYREISSCSNFTDFQARRANIKFRNSKGELQFVHTLNGSGLAVGRTVVAIIENYQEDKNTIVIPNVLQDFMGCDEISF